MTSEIVTPHTQVVKEGKYLVCVNDNEHSFIALRLACSKARRKGCTVELLSVVDPADYQGFGGVADKMRKERREEAEGLLKRCAEDAYDWAEIIPTFNVREGDVGEQIVAAVQEDSEVNMLVLGTSPETPGRGALLPWLANVLGEKLHIPMMIVPGNLTEQQIKELA